MHSQGHAHGDLCNLHQKFGCTTWPPGFCFLIFPWGWGFLSYFPMGGLPRAFYFFKTMPIWWHGLLFYCIVAIGIGETKILGCLQSKILCIFNKICSIKMQIRARAINQEISSFIKSLVISDVCSNIILKANIEDPTCQSLPKTLTKQGFEYFCNGFQLKIHSFWSLKYFISHLATEILQIFGYIHKIVELNYILDLKVLPINQLNNYVSFLFNIH